MIHFIRHGEFCHNFVTISYHTLPDKSTPNLTKNRTDSFGFTTKSRYFLQFYPFLPVAPSRMRRASGSPPRELAAVRLTEGVTPVLRAFETNRLPLQDKPSHGFTNLPEKERPSMCADRGPGAFRPCGYGPPGAFGDFCRRKSYAWVQGGHKPCPISAPQALLSNPFSPLPPPPAVVPLLL